jgi:hypothetical protein
MNDSGTTFCIKYNCYYCDVTGIWVEETICPTPEYDNLGEELECKNCDCRPEFHPEDCIYCNKAA